MPSSQCHSISYSWNRRISQLLCCLVSLILSSCVTTDELYAEYDDLACRVIVEQPVPVLEKPVQRASLGYTLHKWQPVVFFDYNSVVLSTDTIQRLRVALNVIRKYPGSKLALQGFADHRGGTRYNLELARRRVNAIRDWLVDNGVDDERISLRAMGEGLQSFGEDDVTTRANNRRVELMLLNALGLPQLQMYDLQSRDPVSDD